MLTCGPTWDTNIIRMTAGRPAHHDQVWSLELWPKYKAWLPSSEKKGPQDKEIAEQNKERLIEDSHLFWWEGLHGRCHLQLEIASIHHPETKRCPTKGKIHGQDQSNPANAVMLGVISSDRKTYLVTAVGLPTVRAWICWLLCVECSGVQGLLAEQHEPAEGHGGAGMTQHVWGHPEEGLLTVSGQARGLHHSRG